MFLYQQYFQHLVCFYTPFKMVVAYIYIQLYMCPTNNKARLPLRLFARYNYK
jgi:hypothetical protein